jgi:hypothetical protein
MENERMLDPKCEEKRPRADVSSPRKVPKLKKTEEPLNENSTIGRNHQPLDRDFHAKYGHSRILLVAFR